MAALSSRSRTLIVGVPIMASVLLVVAGYLLQLAFAPLNKPSPSYTLHSLVSFAIVIAFGTPSLLIHVRARRRSLIDDSLPRLLDDIAEGQETGMTLVQSLEASSQRSYGPLTGELKRLVAQLNWGVNFDDALRAFAKRCDTQLTVKSITLLIEAFRAGGDLKASFKATADFTRRIVELSKERESQLRPYLSVIYLTTIIFMGILYLIYTSFFVSIAQEAGGTSFMRIPMSADQFKGILFDVAVVEAVLGGLTCGKLTQGSIYPGCKHVFLLQLVVAVFFSFFF